MGPAAAAHRDVAPGATSADGDRAEAPFSNVEIQWAQPGSAAEAAAHGDQRLLPHELLELNQPSGQEVPVFWIGLPAGHAGDHLVLLLQRLVALAISGGLVLAAAA